MHIVLFGLMSRLKAIWLIIFLAAMIVVAPMIVFGATVKGTVYNIYLDELDKAVLTIDTTPQQTFVSKNGVYSFEVPNGNFKLLAMYDENGTMYKTEEDVVIANDGEYVIDLILVPQIDDEDILDNTTDEAFATFEQETSNIGLVITLVMILFLLLYILFTKTHFIKEDVSEKKEETNQASNDIEEALPDTVDDADYGNKLVVFLKERDGRATQKEIRKQFPLSEAKISLLIAELESKQIVKKIKKGRSNIIILN